MCVAEVFGRFFLDRGRNSLALLLGQQLLGLAPPLVGEAGGSFFQVSLLEVTCVRARESRERRDVFPATVPVGEKNRLGTQGFVLDGCGFDERA